MKTVRFELRKIFTDKFFIGMLAFTVFLNCLVLIETKTDAEPASLPYATYDAYIDTVSARAEALSEASVFGGELPEFSKKNIEKTASDFEKLRGIQLSPEANTGIQLLFHSEIGNFCTLLLLIGAGLSLIVTEKEKRLFHLVRATRNGTVNAILSKLAALFVCSLVIQTVISISTACFVGLSGGFGDLHRSVQSIPELFTCGLRLNVLQFLLLLFGARVVGTFLAGSAVLLCCLWARRSITMLIAVAAVSTVNLSLSLIPETSRFYFFKYINLYSLLDPYIVLRSYVNLNLFGRPVHAIPVFGIFSVLTGGILFTAVIVCFVKKRPLENVAKASHGVLFSGRVYGSVLHFEWKKLLFLNKVAVILLLFAVFQTFSVYRQENFQSSADYYYQYCMRELAGPLTPEKERALLRQKEEIDKAEEQIGLLNEQRRDGQISLQELIKQQANYSEILERAEPFDRVYERYLYVKKNPDAVFMNDLGYEKLFGISEPDFSVKSSVLFYLYSPSACVPCTPQTAKQTCSGSSEAPHTASRRHDGKKKRLRFA